MNSISPEASINDAQDPDITRWAGYKKLYDILAGHAKERWQCGYNVLQMFLREYANIDVPLYTLQYYLRMQANKFKAQEGEIANLTPEENLKFGEFTQLEDMAAYIFGIKPFSEEFNECMYYPALTSVCVGGNKEMQVEALYANEGGRYIDNSQECKDARSTHLACVIEKSKYCQFRINGQDYTGGQLFARDWDGKGYILKGPDFDKIRSKIAVEDQFGQKFRVGGHQTTVSNLFSYEYDKKIYEQDRRYFSEIFYIKLKNYFNLAGHHAGIPVVFNAMIYLIVDVTFEPEPSVLMLDPHDMTYMGEKFKDKKKRVPMSYILGSPTGATLFFPPIRNAENVERIKAGITDQNMLREARERFSHLLELALYNRESYLRVSTKKNVGEPAPELAPYFRILQVFGENVFDNAVLDEVCRVFSTNKGNMDDVINFLSNLPFSFDLLAGELHHHCSELTKEYHFNSLQDLFKTKNVFISLPSFLKSVKEKGLPGKDRMLWQCCIQTGEYINMNRINAGLGPATRAPLRQEDLDYYTYIFRGLLYLFNSQDRYSHVEFVEEFLGNDIERQNLYLIAAIGEGLVRGNAFRNIIWGSIVENALTDLAERIHKLLHGSVQFEISIDRFLKQMEKGDSRIGEHLVADLAKEYNVTANYLFLPLDGVLWMVDQLKNRLKDLNIIKRQLLVAVSGNITSHADLKTAISKNIMLDIPTGEGEYHHVKKILLHHANVISQVIMQGVFDKNLIYAITDGSIFKDPARTNLIPELAGVIDTMRIQLGKDLNGLNELITEYIGNIGTMDYVSNVIQFNELFKLEGSKDSEFASKINQVYSDKYERLDLEEDTTAGNITPLLLKPEQ